MIEHKENCLIINGKQNVKFESGSISFKNYFKQLPVPFKIYDNFECILKKVECDSIKNNSSYTDKYQSHIPCRFTYRVVCKNFNKNLVMSTEEEKERFQLSNFCWICNKLFHVGDEKVRDQRHITGKYRGASHWSCNINLKLSKRIPVIFHNLRGYESHLIFKEVSNFVDLKVSVIPNGLEKYMAFTINRNLVFNDSMQFMNSSLDSLVKNLLDHDFVCLSEGFSGKFLN